LVNCVWGGDPLTDWEHPLWEQDLDAGLRADQAGGRDPRDHQPVRAPAAGRGASAVWSWRFTDGNTARYRGSFFYDLAKSARDPTRPSPRRPS